MAEKVRNPIVDYAVFVVVRIFVCLVQAMPTFMAFALADALGWLAHRIDKRHRNVAAENLRAAFPELEHQPIKLDRLVRGTFRHFAHVLIEIILLPRKLRGSNWRQLGTSNSGRPGVHALFGERAALIVTCHLGNWEMAGFMLGAIGFKSYAIARTLDNPYLNRFFLRFREGTGQTIIAKKDDFDRLQIVLKNGGKVATLADQDAGPRGVFVPYFGRPASTHKAVALMAIEFDAEMVVLGVPRLGQPMYYSIVVEDVIDPRDYTGRSDAVKAITERYTAAIERLVRRHPEQYFWLHRRWKSQPAVKKSQAAKAA